MFFQLLISAITVGCIYALIALSFTIIYSSTRILNFAQGEIAMLGALFGATFYSSLNLPYVISLILTISTVIVLGIIIEKLAFEPLIRRKAHLHSLILITMGLAMFFTSSAEQIWGKNSLYVKAPLGDKAIEIFGSFILPQSFLVVGTTILALMIVWYFYDYTQTGKRFRAVSINREAASLMGINIRRVIMATFALSCGLSALAGFMFSPLVPTGAYMGVTLGIKGISAALVGGLGNNLGAVLGGMLIGLVETFGAGYISAGYRDAFAFLVMLLVLVISPKGLLGKSTRDY